jgi:predicted RNase H-like nuclease
MQAVKGPRAQSNIGMTWVAGVDGCRGGWFVLMAGVTKAAEHPVQVASRLCRDFREVLALPEQPVIITVDMPIGLLARPSPGGRVCDWQARKLLRRPRASSVFSPPTRAGLAALSYADVAQLNGAGMSKQAFHILPKIREVDQAITPRHQRSVVEAHPELAFMNLAGSPMRHNKKTLEGRDKRMRLLRGVFGNCFQDPARLRREYPATKVALDDVIDAYVLANLAERIWRGVGNRVPEGQPPKDSRGLRMEIWY